jgi:hypothetical protein
MVGFINDTDAARDARQQTGIGAGIMGSTKYVDNIVEIFTDKLDNVTGEELYVATRGGALKDANPILRIMGVTLKPARTATEKVYSMAEAHPWKANERSQIPAYDKAFNKLIQPMFEDTFSQLVNTEGFKKGSVAKRKEMLNYWKNSVKKELKTYMEDSSEFGVDAARKKAVSVPKTFKHEAMKIMEEEYGYKGSVQEMNWEELQYFMTITDYFRELSKGAQ